MIFQGSQVRSIASSLAALMSASRSLPEPLSLQLPTTNFAGVCAVARTAADADGCAAVDATHSAIRVAANKRQCGSRVEGRAFATMGGLRHPGHSDRHGALKIEGVRVNAVRERTAFMSMASDRRDSPSTDAVKTRGEDPVQRHLQLVRAEIERAAAGTVRP